MPDRNQMTKAAIGSLLIGAGIAFMVSAASGCVKGEEALEDVAVASAEMASEVAQGEAAESD